MCVTKKWGHPPLNYLHPHPTPLVQIILESCGTVQIAMTERAREREREK